MTTTETTTARALEPYLGRKVVGAGIEIRGTGSGLDKAMAMPPLALPPGETVDVVLRCNVEMHRHDYDDEDGTFVLVNILRAETATIVDPGEVAAAALDAAEQRVAERRAEIEAAKRSADGEDPLPGITTEHSDDPERVGLARPDLDAAEQVIRDRARPDCTECGGEGAVETAITFDDQGVAIETTWRDCERCNGEGVVTELADVIALEDAAPDDEGDG